MATPAPRKPPKNPFARARARRTAWAVGALVVLLAAIAAMFEPVSDWLWPEARVLELERAAGIALKTGVISAADGRGARELYAAALALDPDRPQARAGLARVGEAALQAGNAALVAGQVDEAARMLAVARELQVPREGVDALAAGVRAADASRSDIERMLQSASLAHRLGRLDGTPDAAAPLYARVLALQPGRTEALEGREDVLADLLQQARGVLARGDIVGAAARIERVRELDAGHVVLPEALAALAQAAERRRAQADADLAARRLAEAEAGYRAVIAVESESAAAAAGLARIADAWIVQARRDAGDFRIAEARSALQRAAALAPGTPALQDAEAHLARVDRLARQRGRLPPQREADVRRLVEQASEAEARGNLIAPPGESAFDRLRAARAIAPNDGLVRAATARLLPLAQACFERELRGNQLSRAGECLDAWQALGGEDVGTRVARGRLAQRWIAVGDERLGAGELRAAQSALDAAYRLDATVDGLAEFAARLRTASAAN